MRSDLLSFTPAPGTYLAGIMQRFLLASKSRAGNPESRIQTLISVEPAHDAT